MLCQRVIPSLLLKNKRLVKGNQYKNFRDAGNPATTARAHNHQGADELIVFDIDASFEKRAPDIETLKLVAEECFMPLCIGGGISNRKIADDCMEAGADKLCLTTAALDNPGLISELACHFGSQAIVVGVDVIISEDGKYSLFDHRYHAVVQNKDLWDWVREIALLGAGEIRLMTVNREGTLLGYDIDLFLKVRSLINIPIILEGGAGSLEHLKSAALAGVDGLAIGSMLVFSDANLVKIKRYMLNHECHIRE